jgi:hypothetical protein
MKRNKHSRSQTPSTTLRPIDHDRTLARVTGGTDPDVIINSWCQDPDIIINS